LYSVCRGPRAAVSVGGLVVEFMIFSFENKSHKRVAKQRAKIFIRILCQRELSVIWLLNSSLSAIDLYGGDVVAVMCASKWRLVFDNLVIVKPHKGEKWVFRISWGFAL
jgi:hypothetical protein